MLPLAGLLASHGYVATVVAFLDEPGLPAALQEVPLEHLAAGMRHAVGQPEVDRERVAVVAASVGTEGALSVLATEEEEWCRAVVAISPSSVVWQALGDAGRPARTSSWARGGAALPWAPIRGDKLLMQTVPHALLDRFRRHPRPRPLHLRPAYAAGLAHHPAEAEIPAERIEAPLLLLAGEDDQMWPSTDMAEQ
jgi:pimeloyl-ACP methyl ester carboxylesterase